MEALAITCVVMTLAVIHLVLVATSKCCERCGGKLARNTRVYRYTDLWTCRKCGGSYESMK